MEQSPPITLDQSLSRKDKLDRASFLKKFEEFLQLEYLKKVSAVSIPVYVINRSRIRHTAEFIKNYSYQLQAIFVSDFSKVFELNYVYALRPYLDNSQIIIQTENDKSIPVPSIQDIFPNASYQEKNINHRFKIEFTHTSSNVESQKELCLPLSFTLPTSTQNFTQLGIFHPIHQKSHYIDAHFHEGKINNVELRDGWLYKRIQPELEKRIPLNDYISLFDSISQTSNVHLNLSLQTNFEFITQKMINNKVKYIRTLLAELERIQSHLLWLINLADILSADKYYMDLYRLYEDFSLMCGKYFLNTQLRNTIKYGSVTDISASNAQTFLRYMKNTGWTIFEKCHKLVYDKFTEDKCSGIGVISKQDAIKIGLTGPSLRGSGVPIDIRYTDPYLIYATGEMTQIWDVITFPKGDVYARTQVRLWEMHESLEICIFILEGLVSYEMELKPEMLPKEILLEPDRHLFNCVESPQGALSMYCRTHPKNKSSKFYTVRLITPDVQNYAVLEKFLLINEELSSVPLIIHSLDLNFDMIDL